MGKVAPGGRLTSRLTPDGYQFDVGGQFFRARSPAMKARVREWVQAGVVAEWRPVLGLYDTAAGSFTRREEMSKEQHKALAGSFFDALSAGAENGPLYVGVPSMGALVAHLLQPHARSGRGGADTGSGLAAGSLQLHLNSKVRAARLSEGRWWLTGARTQPDVGDRATTAPPGAGAAPDGPLGCFDALVLADSQVARQGSPGHVSFSDGAGGPPPAALADLLRRLAALPRAPLLTLTLAWGEDGGAAQRPLLPGGAEAAVLTGGPGTAFQWLAADCSKPGRPHAAGQTLWVAVTRPDFAAQLLRPPVAGPGAAAGAGGGGGGGDGLPGQDAHYRAGLAAQLWAALQRDLRASHPGPEPLPPPRYMSAQRWGSALPVSPLGQPAVWDDAGRWAACGDFCDGPGIEAAAQSGGAAAEAVAASLGLP